MSSRIRGLSLSSLGMLPRLACCVLLVALRVASANEAIPQTPAGSTLAAWLEAFNSGDRDQLDGYYKTYDPSKKADDVMGFRSRTGGFDLVSIQRNEPLHIEFLVKERAGPTEAFGELEVINTVPARVTKEALLAIAHRRDAHGLHHRRADPHTCDPGCNRAAERVLCVPRSREENGAGDIGAGQAQGIRLWLRYGWQTPQVRATYRC